MLKTSTSHRTKVDVRQIIDAFNNHSLVRIKKHDGQIVGPGHIAIMYGPVAFRMYPDSAGESSHFVRVEEIAEVTVG